ncbi:hypothetical protein BH23PLA1_BH23PLA1_16450 [soil metagenome]
MMAFGLQDRLHVRTPNNRQLPGFWDRTQRVLLLSRKWSALGRIRETANMTSGLLTRFGPSERNKKREAISKPSEHPQRLQ